MHNFCIMSRPFGVNGLVSPLQQQLLACLSFVGKESTPKLLLDEVRSVAGDDRNATATVDDTTCADADSAPRGGESRLDP